MMWKKFDGTIIEIPLEKELEKRIVEEKANGHRLKVCIGTDSQVKQNFTEFATAIVFIREKSGGFMYFNNDFVKQPFSLKERMIAEVSKSIDIAYKLCSLFDLYDLEMEIHADINTDPKFKSNDSLKEAMGYILGMGFSFKAKPYAFASSSCANKLVQ